MLLAGLQLAYFVTWTPYDLAIHGIFLDDAYSYAVLARNFHQLGSLTFDGEMPTNGVQPLWMLVQIILVKLLPQFHEVTLLGYASWVCFLLFSFLSIWFVTQGLSPYRQVTAALTMAGLLVLNVRFQALVVRGLETSITLVLLVLTLLVIDNSVSQARVRATHQLSARNTVSLAVCASLCFLARTDFFWIGFVLGAWLVLTHGARHWNVIAYWIVILIFTLPYLSFNYLTQASIVPISGRVKLFYMTTAYPNWGDYFYSDEWLGLFTAFVGNFPQFWRLPSAVTIIVTGGTIATAQWLIWRNRDSSVFPISLRLLTGAILGHVIFMYLVYGELRPYSAYYFAPELFWSVLVLIFYVSRWQTRGKRWGNAGFNGGLKVLQLLLALASIGIAGKFWMARNLQPSPYWLARVALAHDIQQQLPEDQLYVGAFWPGTFAQFSGKRVMPLDGIVGSNEYFQYYVRPGREIDYILERLRPYLAVYLTKSPDQLFREKQLETNPWNTGMTRVWELGQTKVHVLAARRLNSQGAGWYLLELKTPSAKLSRQ